MARFASLAELEVFLCKLEPEYAQYASVLWQRQVRAANQLANASKSLLLSWGLLELHVDDIKARAGSTGEHSASNSTRLTKFSSPVVHKVANVSPQATRVVSLASAASAPG